MIKLQDVAALGRAEHPIIVIQAFFAMFDSHGILAVLCLACFVTGTVSIVQEAAHKRRGRAKEAHKAHIRDKH